MNEQSNVALIQKLYAAFGAGDVQTILGNTAPDAEWTNSGPDTVPYAGDFSGRVLAFFQAIADSTTGGKVVADRFIAQDDTVVTVGRYSATVRGNGATIDVPIVHVFRVRDGKVASWTGFSDTAAVAAAHSGTARSAGR